MALAAGRKLGPYEILSPLGSGGMGEVYRARDTRLDRMVAIKILPPHLSGDTGLRQRFEREAKAISSLNHPHICVLHDIGNQDGTAFLVMECVEGETLAKRLERGPLPLKQVLQYGMQIADALDKAHRSGVVHRDLKPGNIILAASGAKLLDFGLAKTMPPALIAATLTVAATQTNPVTDQGTIVGTFPYMSPEQVQGKEVDARSDIFSFGSVLYEMVTGRRAFAGKSQISIASAILEKEPEPVATVQPLTPPALDYAIRVCLAKEPEERWQTARDLLLQLKWLTESGAATTSNADSASKLTRKVVWGCLALLLLVALALTFQLVRARTQLEQHARPVKSSIIPAADVALSPVPLAVISPDGTRLVYGGYRGSEGYKLWLHSLETGVAQPLTPVDPAGIWIAWSPDGRYILFQGDSKLKKVDIGGGVAQSLAPVTRLAGVTCNSKGDVLFARDASDGLSRISLAGGPVTPVTQLDSSRHEVAHSFPRFLPDGRHFLFLVRTTTGEDGIWVGSLDSAERKQLFPSVAPAVYVAPGYVLFLRDQNLLAQKFDAGTLRTDGDPFLVAENISFNFGLRRASFSAATNGMLLFHVGGSLIGGQLQWFDRSGHGGHPIATDAVFTEVRISPDGRRFSEIIVDVKTSTADIWIQEIDRGARTRFTFGAARIQNAVWSPDGEWLAFASNRNGNYDLYRKRATGVGEEELLLKDAMAKGPDDWSRDGRYLVYGATGESGKRDLWVLPLQGDRKPFLFLQSNFNKMHARFSPDGHWVAYDTDESGTIRVYVVSFPDAKTKLQVSTDGGVQAIWARTGRELVYLTRSLTQNQVIPLMSVEVASLGNTLRLSAPREIFRPRFFGGPIRNAFDVTPDGNRFLVNSAKEDVPVAPFTLYQNWLAAARK
jgi:serine/threonine protein kinase/Tol biopolymer transport system component